MPNRDMNEITEKFFQAIDIIVTQHLKKLDFDKTIIATITNNTKAIYGCYEVTTDNNIIFNAYCDNINYKIGQKVYIRIPGGDYSKQKVITGRYIQENNKNIITFD